MCSQQTRLPNSFNAFNVRNRNESAVVTCFCFGLLDHVFVHFSLRLQGFSVLFLALKVLVNSQAEDL